MKKIKLQLAAALTALAITSNVFPVYAVSTGGLPEATVPPQDNTAFPGSLIDEDTQNDNFSTGQFCSIRKQSAQGGGTVSSGDPSPSSADTPSREAAEDRTDGSGTGLLHGAPDEAPAFSARIEYFDGQGYLVRGTFTEFLPDTCFVQPLYSLDGEAWQPSLAAWNLQWLGKDTPDDQRMLQNQTCLFGAHEPLASYLAGTLDRFYLKLQITLENGTTYETQTAVIDRGDPRPIPEKYEPDANFASAILVRQWRPFKSHGQCQVTVSADATPEEISALLPDTLPIRVYLSAGVNDFTDAVVDCPVTWNPLSLPRLTPGESVTIENAAEEILVPAGTLLNTPTGIFQLNEPLGFEHDEVKLILNVVEENAEPTGTLTAWHAGLEISFDLKPTGATAIRAYTLSEGDAAWTEISAPLLPEKVNTPSSTASSLFTFVLTAGQEPYRSWLSAWNAGADPRPFLVGLKIEGGVYDGQQLILAYPDTYKIPLQPPAITGSGGNEGNAGSDNKNDSTPEGQRPNLPQDTGDKIDMQNPQGTESAHQPDDTQDSSGMESTQETGLTPESDSGQVSQAPKPTPGTGNDQAAQKPRPTQTPESSLNAQTSGNRMDAQTPERSQNAQTLVLAQMISVRPKGILANPVQALKESAGNPAWIPSIDGKTASPAWEKKRSDRTQPSVAFSRHSDNSRWPLHHRSSRKLRSRRYIRQAHCSQESYAHCTGLYI